MDLGPWGEEMACKHLVAQGYQVLQRNFRFKKSEIDIIVRKDQTIAAVEVKTRAGTLVGSPLHSINKTKQRHLIVGINHYVQLIKEPVEVRMDAIIIIKQGDNITIDHIMDAFPAF